MKKFNPSSFLGTPPQRHPVARLPLQADADKEGVAAASSSLKKQFSLCESFLIVRRRRCNDVGRCNRNAKMDKYYPNFYFKIKKGKIVKLIRKVMVNFQCQLRSDSIRGL